MFFWTKWRNEWAEIERADTHVRAVDKDILMWLCGPLIEDAEIQSVPFDLWSLQDLLYKLSERYQTTNPSLSIAFHTLWDSMQANVRDEKWFPVWFSHKKAEKRFLRYRGLMCSAVIHYADGDATPNFIVANPWKDAEKYERAAWKAMNLVKDDRVE